MKKRGSKKEEVEKLNKNLAQVSTVILTTFQGITVAQDTQLRRSVQAVGGHYEVVKNTLAERAGTGTPGEPILKGLSGTNSIAFTASDPVSLAKVLTKVAKDVPAFKFKAGVVEGRVLSIAEIVVLSQLPSKEELLSKVLFLIQAPTRRVASATAAVMRNLAATMQEAVKAEKFSQQSS
jgi:large subunit ribosomal protein L10